MRRQPHPVAGVGRVQRRFRRQQMVAGLALAGGVIAAVGTFATWYRIEVGGLSAPGGVATGWEGSDGRSVIGAAVVAVLAGIAGMLPRFAGRLAPKVALLVAGTITSITAVAGITAASGKAEAVQEEFGLAAGRVTASVGVGLFLVAAAGIAELAAGVVASGASRLGADRAAQGTLRRFSGRGRSGAGSGRGAARSGRSASSSG